jgi:hypothetical protein
MDTETDLIYSPKQNWHDRKKWNDGIHTRRSIVKWIRQDEEFTLDKNGTPYLTYPCVSRESGEPQWVYDTVPIRSAANIEKRWLRGYRYRNDDPSGYWCGPVMAGKSSRRGMKEKAKWWQEAFEYFEYREDFAA